MLLTLCTEITCRAVLHKTFKCVPHLWYSIETLQIEIYPPLQTNSTLVLVISGAKAVDDYTQT